MIVQVQESARKDLKRIDREMAKKILEKIRLMEAYPELPQIKKLKNHYPPFRMRVGEYRILFDVEGNRLIVVAIRHRREAYHTKR